MNKTLPTKNQSLAERHAAFDAPELCPCGSNHKPWWRYDWRTNLTTWICEKCTDRNS